MKTYTVLFAQDVPHYGSVEIRAKDDAQALARAKAYWKKVARSNEPLPLDDADFNNGILSRIVVIYDDGDREVACDIRLDEYLLNRAPTELDARTFDNAKLTFEALQAVMHWWQNTAHTDDDEMPATIFDQAQKAIAKVKGGDA